MKTQNCKSKGYTTLEVICSLILFAFVAASIAIILPMAYQNMSGWRDRLNLSRYLEAHLEEGRSKSYDNLSVGDTGLVSETTADGHTYQYRQQIAYVTEATDSNSQATWSEISNPSNAGSLPKKTIITVVNPSTSLNLSGFFLTFPTVTSINGNISVQYYCNFRDHNSNTLGPWFRIYNTGSEAIDPSVITLRYWFKSEGSSNQVFECDWAANQANLNNQIQNKVTARFIGLTNTFKNANTYVEIGFKPDLQTLAPGQYVELQCRIHTTNWKNYVQTNDYSFDSTYTSYNVNTKITAYVNNNLVFGVEPN